MTPRTRGRWPLTLLVAMALLAFPAHAWAQGKKKPRAGEKPKGESPAPGAESPAPGAESPAPGAESPAPGAEAPAPGAEAPPPTPRPELPPKVEPPRVPPKPEPPPEPPPRLRHRRRPDRMLPRIQSKYGSLQIGGALAARLVMPFRTISSDWQTFKGADPQNVAFELAGAWIDFAGHLGTRHLEYHLRAGYGMHTPLVLDAKLTYHLPWVKGLSISAGRFFPEFGLVGHRVFTQLGTAEYPIYLTEGGYGVWEQLGFEIAYRHALGPGVLRAALGVFNGVPDGWTDDNQHKDVFIRADYSLRSGPAKGLKAGINAWIGFPHCIWDSANPAASTCTEEDALRHEADTEMKLGLLVAYKRRFTRWVKPKAMMEFWFRRFTPWAENRDPWNGIAFWLHAGVRIGKLLEPVIRFEYLKEMTKTATGGTDKDNWAWRLTAGLNIYLYRTLSHIKVNYIFESWGDTFVAPNWIDMQYGANPLTDPMTAETNVHLLLVTANTEF